MHYQFKYHSSACQISLHLQPRHRNIYFLSSSCMSHSSSNTLIQISSRLTFDKGCWFTSRKPGMRMWRGVNSWHGMATCVQGSPVTRSMHGIEDWFRGDGEDWNDSNCKCRFVVSKLTISFEMMFDCKYLGTEPCTS